MMALEGARIARYELPGKRWYVAVCEECRWVAMGWKNKAQAKFDRDAHNVGLHDLGTHHGPKTLAQIHGCKCGNNPDGYCPVHKWEGVS